MAFQELFRAVQGSHEEILNALKKQDVMVLKEERCCILKESYASEVLDMVLSLVMENIDDSWPTALPWQTCVGGLEDQYPAAVLAHVITSTCKGADKSKEKWELDMDKVAIFRAKQLFRKNETWLHTAFRNEWAQSMPSIDQTPPSPELLKGIALSVPVKKYQYFLAADLPREPKACFERVFEMQATWELGDLVPYLNHLVGPGVSQAQLLLKYTRSSVAVGSKDRVYSRRK